MRNLNIQLHCWWELTGFADDFAEDSEDESFYESDIQEESGHENGTDVSNQQNNANSQAQADEATPGAIDADDGYRVGFDSDHMGLTVPTWQAIRCRFPRIERIRIDDTGVWSAPTMAHVVERLGAAKRAELIEVCPIDLCLQYKAMHERSRADWDTKHKVYNKDDDITWTADHYADVEKAFVRRRERRGKYPQLDYIDKEERVGGYQGKEDDFFSISSALRSDKVAPRYVA